MPHRCLWCLVPVLAVALVCACGGKTPPAPVQTSAGEASEPPDPVDAASAREGTARGAFQARPFDWPQWQGKDRTAVSREPGLLKSWPKEGPPLAWQIKSLGEGYATP